MVLPGMNAVLDAYLKFLSDGSPRTNKDVLAHFYKKFEMTAWERRARTRGGIVKIKSRRSWAKSTLKSNGLISYLPNKKVQITAKGLELLASRDSITPADLKSMPGGSADEASDTEGIDEKIEDYALDVKRALCDEVLSRLNQMDPYDFERVVVDLLEAMKYGRGRQTLKTRDGGIDGVVTADPLGLEKVYVQAKQRQKDAIGPGEMQAFAGAISAQKSKKGVFVTTSDFTDKAREFAAATGVPIVLINGNELASYMYDYGVGFVKRVIDIKQIDDNYFVD